MENLQQHIAALERHVGDQAKSPLFARLASLYLDAGRPKDALRMCDAGLAHYPFYATGHLIKGRALLSLELPNEARREFEFVHSWLPTNPTVTSLLASIPVSEDQLLVAPEAHPPMESPIGFSTPKPESSGGTDDESPGDQAAATGGDFFSAMTSQAPPEGGAVEPASEAGSKAEAEANVFGLPSEAPVGEVMDDAAGSSDMAFGTMEGFGGGEQPTVAGSEEGFWEYAERMKGELGPTGVRTLEEYLSSPPAEAASATEETLSADTTSPEESGATFFGADQQETENPVSAETVSATDDSLGAFETGGLDDAESAVSSAEETAADAGVSEQSIFGEPAPEYSEAVTENVEDNSTVESAESPETTFGTTEDFAGEQQPADASTEAVSDESDPVFTVSSTDGIEGAEPADEGVAGLTELEQSTDGDPAPGTDAPAEGTTDSDGFSGPDFSGLSVPEGSEQAESSEGAFGELGVFEGPPTDVPQEKGTSNRIEEFAEKLQDAKKITPVIDFSSKVSSSSPGTADETAAGAGFVTPTLAEIYAKQGWFDDAINAYRTLAKTRPAEQDKFEQRIAELEEEKKKAD